MRGSTQTRPADRFDHQGWIMAPGERALQLGGFRIRVELYATGIPRRSRQGDTLKRAPIFLRECSATGEPNLTYALDARDFESGRL
jgi:hypothetical protein